MPFSVTVAQTPALARLSDPLTAGRGYLRDAQRDAGAVLVADLAARSAGAGSISQGWHAESQDAGDTLTLVITNSNPGAAFLNAGATWPGKMPPWGDGSPLAAWAVGKGLVPFLVARKLQRTGLTARHWTADALAAHQAEIGNITRDAVRRWLGGLR